ncbi:unnamed protein product [Allacma fusca]|uniref:Uncharacterized protein n=1 Tax=Allacma fusca TaxID=39272 RepID=A0A8J2NV39_9HEXA|nr:unnamed protein product [Allacma fusca]
MEICTERLNFRREYYSIFRAMAIVNYGVFSWNVDTQRIFPSEIYRKTIWNSFALTSAGFGFVYTFAILSSDYVDLSKLEIHNLSVVAPDILQIFAIIYVFVLDLNLHCFNSNIIESINAILELDELGREEFQAIGNWSKGFETLVKMLRIIRKGGMTPGFLYYFRETSMRVFYDRYGFPGQLVNAIVGFYFGLRTAITMSFYIVVNLGHSEFLEFWIRHLIRYSVHFIRVTIPVDAEPEPVGRVIKLAFKGPEDP